MSGQDTPSLSDKALQLIREEPLMIWGGAQAKSGKKTQRLLARENSTQQPGRKKNKSTTWKKNLCPFQPVGQEKRPHQPVGQEKKNQHEFSARGHLQIINGPSLNMIA